MRFGHWAQRDIQPLTAVCIALTLVAVSFGLQSRIGLNLADEGFLWHGAMQTLIGEVPIRDFQSYDPGRYYWSAFWMKIFDNNGIISLRRAVAIFQAGALSIGLLALRRVVGSPAPFVIASITIVLWSFPRHKLFDISIALASVYFATILIEKPTRIRHFYTGLFVGAVAVFGRNHGVYTLLGLASVVLFLWLRVDRAILLSKFSAFFFGIALGYAPMLLIAVTQEGFSNAMAESVLQIFRNAATNTQVPIPWPWEQDYNLPWKWKLHHLFVGSTFLVMPIYYFCSVVFIFCKFNAGMIKRHSVFLGSIAVGVFYLHYAFSRADVGHLAHSMPPFLLAVFATPTLHRDKNSAITRAIPLLLLVFSIISAGMMSPLYAKISQKYVQIDVRGDKLFVDSETASAVAAVQSIEKKFIRPGEQILFAPYWPTMYGVLGHTSPVWLTYAVWKNDVSGQARYIKELDGQQVKWAVVGNATLDGSNELRFNQTHPILWQYINDHYQPVEISGLPADYRLLRRR